MDRPKLYLVPAPAPAAPVDEKNILQFGRIWPRHRGWHKVECKPGTVPTKLRAVPPQTPESPAEG